MPKNRELKISSRRIMGRTVPHAAVVSLVYYLLTRTLSILDEKISGAQLLVDIDSYMAGNIESAFTFKGPSYTALGIILTFAIYFVTVMLFYGFLFYCLDISRGKKCGVMSLLDGFSVWWKAFLLNLLMLIFTALWSVLLVVPGIIALFRYSMAPFLLHDHPDWGVMRCIRESSRLMKGNKGRLLSLDLSFIGWILLTLFPAVSIFVTPYINCAKAEFYNRLIGYVQAEPEAKAEEKPPWEY